MGELLVGRQVCPGRKRSSKQLTRRYPKQNRLDATQCPPISLFSELWPSSLLNSPVGSRAKSRSTQNCFESGFFMRAFWKGHLPLPRAFWQFAILYMVLANVCATGAAFAALAANFHIGAVIMIFLSPLPYTVVAIVGVWRSAETYCGPSHWTTLARYATIIWSVVMVIV
jgi:hypothetical protein